MGTSMTLKGWIKLYRDLLDHPIWLNSTPEQKSILVALLLKVNHSVGFWEWQGKRFQLGPGQIITSIDSILHFCGKGISQQNVRTALKRFEKLEFLTNESTNAGRLITIVNWEHYQGNNDESNKQNNSQITSNSQAGNKRLTTNKNIIMNKKEKNIENTGETDFDFFCKKYPKKDSIRECIRIWNELPFPDRKAVILSLPNYNASVSHRKYIKKPMNFLLERHWEKLNPKEFNKEDLRYNSSNGLNSTKRLQDF